MSDDVVTVTCRPCPVCEERATLTVSRVGYGAWQAGAFVQDAFPELSADDRELLITGTHPACWNELIGDEES